MWDTRIHFFPCNHSLPSFSSFFRISFSFFLFSVSVSPLFSPSSSPNPFLYFSFHFLTFPSQKSKNENENEVECTFSLNQFIFVHNFVQRKFFLSSSLPAFLLSSFLPAFFLSSSLPVYCKWVYTYLPIPHSLQFSFHHLHSFSPLFHSLDEMTKTWGHLFHYFLYSWRTKRMRKERRNGESS